MQSLGASIMALSTNSVLSRYAYTSNLLCLLLPLIQTSSRVTGMRLEKTSIPFAWYWEGRPLRGNQIRPVYTGPAPYPSNSLECGCPSHFSAECAGWGHSSSTNKTHQSPDAQIPESECCSSETYACCENAESETCCCSLCYGSDPTTTTSSTCSQPSESASSSSTCSTASTTPSSIHYHAHAYFCYPGYDCPPTYPYSSSSPSDSTCSCASCQSYYAYSPASASASASAPAPTTRTTKHQCPGCPPLSSQTQSKTALRTTATASMTDTCHDQCCSSEHYPHYPHYPRTKAGPCAHFEDASEDDSATMSSGYTESVYSDCGEKEACQCCGPSSAWRYRDHPAYRKRY